MTNKFMTVSDYIDHHGTLDKQNGDGGDSAAYLGTAAALTAMTGKVDELEKGFFAIALDKHVPAPGIVVRHFAPKTTSSMDWDRGSRDQIDPIIIGAGYLAKDVYKRYTRGSYGFARWGVFAHNYRQNGATKHNHGRVADGDYRDYNMKIPDLLGPEHWACKMRARKWWFLFPIVWVCDLFTLGSAIGLKLDKPKPDPDRGGQMRWKKNITQNHTLRCLNGINRIWSPVMAFALWLNGIDDLTARMQQHFEDFGRAKDGSWVHIHPIANLYRVAYKGLKKRNIFKRFFCLD